MLTFGIDDYTVSYAPSMSVLSMARHRLKSGRLPSPGLLAVINPTDDLPFASLEGEGVVSLFSDYPRLEMSKVDATPREVLRNAPGYAYLHFACHGIYQWRDVMKSGLKLAKGGILTLGQLFSDLELNGARLVTLSACETGMTEFEKSPDEYIGLAGSFLQAGACAVISSLWAVNDLSTAVLMREFYRTHLIEKQDPPTALRTAQLYLRKATAAEMGLAGLYERVYKKSENRDRNAFVAMRYCRANPGVKPFEHPYYWAPFTCYGL